MKKAVGILSVFLALSILVCSVTPALSETIRDAFSFQPLVGSINQSAGDRSAADEENTSGTLSNQKEVAYADGKILIYNFTQLSMIGSGKSYQYEDGVSATYALDAAYQIVRDIPIPRHTLWQPPDGFKGKITGSKQSYAPLYDAQGDAIYLYNPYQLAVMAMDDREDQPVMDGDAEASTFGSGKVVCTDEESKHILTYGDDRNYVISAQFCSEVTEKPISVNSKKSVEAVGAKAGDTVGAAAQYDGRDFPGQVIKTIGTGSDAKKYILIGNEAQLRAIGTDAEVFTPVYQVHLSGTEYVPYTDNGKPVQLYGGDADLAEEHNGYTNYTLHNIHTKTNSAHHYAGVNQTTGAVYNHSNHIALETTELIHTNASWKTGMYYSTDENYIIFRDIDLGGQSDPWTPLMFTGTMCGIKSTNNDKLWDGSGITDSTELSAMTETNRPKISNVYVSTAQTLTLNDYIGVGFFATIQSQANSNSNNLGLRGEKAEVKNLDLQNVTVINNATSAARDETVLSTLLSFTGGTLSAVVTALLHLLNFDVHQIAEMIEHPQHALDNQLGAMLDARKDDPDVFATGAFAGRVYGNVNIEDCSVTGTVSVTNNSEKGRTGGFIGYITGFTEYSNLSQLLGDAVDLLAGVLNVIPAIGLGDLITILGKKALPLSQLIAVGYVNPTVNNCTVEGLTGNVGTANAEYAGGFVGEQIGTRINGCKVLNSTFSINARDFGGGFAGLTRDAEIVGTLGKVGGEIEKEVIQNIRPQSTLMNCEVKGCTYSVSGRSYLGGFVGALTSSYSVDCTIDNDQAPLSVSGTGEYIGGFCGYATVGWTQSIGDSTDTTLIGVVESIVLPLLSSNPEDAKALLSISGVSPSAILGCRIYSSSLTVEANSYEEDGKTHGGCFAGGILGKGDGVYIAKSDSAAYTALEAWNSGTLLEDTEPRAIILNGLESVEADVNYSGGVAGYLGSASINGLLNDTAGIGDFIGFTARDITVTGVSGGYTVTSGNYDAGGGFGAAVGGTITNVKLNRIQRAQAYNRAAGFVGVSGPGELVGTGGLTINLLGLNRVLLLNNLLKVGEGVEVHITDCDVTGIDSGFTVEATGTNDPGSENVFEFTAAGFIAESNSTKLTDSHCFKLLSVEASDHSGYAGGFVGSSETGGLAEVADTDDDTIKSLINTDGLVHAIQYLIPEYTNCTANFVNLGYVDADVAGGFAGEFASGTVDNSTIASVDNQQDPKWTKNMKELYDLDAVRATGNLDKQFAVINIDKVKGRTYAGGFGGKLISGALAEAGKGLSILGDSDLGISLDITKLVDIVNAYIPYVKHAGVYSENGFTVEANTVRQEEPNSGSAGGFGGFMSGAQISHCDVYCLKHTEVTPPADLEAVNAPSYFNSGQSTYAVTGGHYAGGYAGKIDVGSAASLGEGLKILGNSIKLADAVSALSVVVSTIEHSDVQGKAGGFSVIADATDSQEGKVGKAGGFAGGLYGGHIQNSHCKNFYYIIGNVAAGGYVGGMMPGDAAKLLDEGSIFSKLIDVDSSLVSLIEDFVPTIRNSTTSCVPCGGAVRAQAASSDEFQRGCAGGFCGINDGGDIWGLNNSTWEDQNDGTDPITGKHTIGNYTGEQHNCTAWRIRSVYGAEYAGGFTGYMESADTAGTSGVRLLGGLISANNVLNALSAVYPTEEHTAVYGPLRNLDAETWNSWVTHVGKYGGYGAELAQNGTVSTQSELNGKISKYIYGCNIVAGRSTHDNMLITEGGNAGGYVGYMVTGVITNGQSYDMKQIRAMRSAGGYAGRMQTGSAAEFGSANILGLNLNVGQLVQAVQVFVPTIKSGSVRGWQSGMTVTGNGTDFTNRCGYAGGYVGSAYGAQIWGDENVGSTAGTGCNVYNLRYVKGNNAAGGYVGLATAASVADVSTNASKGFLQRLLNTLISTPGNLTSVMQATISTIRKAEVSPDNSSFGFTVDGTGGSHPQFAGGFAGSLEASVIGSRKGESYITVNGLRSVDGQYYAGGFVGLADVGSVATVSSTGTGSTNILSLIQAGSVDLLDVFRTYIYYSNVNGVNDGIVAKAYSSAQEGILSETRYSGCAGGFGGGVMNGTVKNSNVTKLNTVVAPNYTGGFIGHAGKNGVVDVDDAAVRNLLDLTAGVLDIFGTVVDDCDVTGIDAGTVIYSVGGEQPIAGGHTGYADVAQIKNSNVTKLKQVCSEQIAGGFVGKTNMNYLVEAEVDSALVKVVLGIVNSLLKILQVHRLEEIDLINTDKLLSELGITNLLGLKLLSDGDLLYVNLFGLRIGVSLVQPDGEGSSTGTAVVTIGDSSVSLPYNENGIDTSGENPEAVINLIKGNRTRVDNCSVTGIDVGYDVYGGGASNTEDGTHADGYAGGFVGYNNEGQFTSDTMIYCDVVRGTAKKVGPFSGGTRLESVYSFNTLASIEGENNKYSVYRSTDKTTALTADNQTISSNPTTDGNYKRFDVTYLADPIKPGENEPYEKIYQKWSGAKLASGASDTSPTPITLYRSSAKAVLMADTPTYANDESLIPNPGESKDPCGNIDLTIQKIWDDQSNKDGSRPAAIKVRILQQKHTVDGTAIGDPVKFLDSSIITDQNFDTTDGWFTISSDDGRADSATWTRVIKGLPVYVTDNGTDYYYSYTVEENSVLGYTADYSYDESGATATITNTPKDFVIEFKYYDRYEENGRPAGIESEETVYSTTLKGIPDMYVIRDASGNVTGVNYAGIIGEEAVEFSDSLGVNNVMCDYDLWTKQRYAVDALKQTDYSYFYFVNGNKFLYSDQIPKEEGEENPLDYHTDYLGKLKNHANYQGIAVSRNEKWVNYYDTQNTENPEISETNAYGADFDKVNKIVVWCYNYPKLYNVDIFGADDESDLIKKTVNGNTVYVADNTKTNKATRNELQFYYNQRFCEATGNAYQDAAGFIENYGLLGYREDVQPKAWAEEFDGYTFAYWAYDQEGKQIASVEKSFGYRVTTKTELYAVYTKGGSSTAGISISANTNDTYVDSSGVSRTRLNILANIYGAPVFDSSIKKLSFVNISLSTQIRDNPTVYTPQRVSALFDQYKDQLKGIIEKFEADNARQFTSAETFNGDINPEPDPETGKYWVNPNLNLTLTAKGYIYNVTSNGGEPKDNTEMKLTNKNRAHFTITYKTSALNVNGTGSNGDTCLIYCGAMKYGDEWKVSTNCLIYYNGSVVKNTDESWG